MQDIILLDPVHGGRHPGDGRMPLPAPDRLRARSDQSIGELEKASKGGPSGQLVERSIRIGTLTRASPLRRVALAEGSAPSITWPTRPTERIRRSTCGTPRTRGHRRPAPCRSLQAAHGDYRLHGRRSRRFACRPALRAAQRLRPCSGEAWFWSGNAHELPFTGPAVRPSPDSPLVAAGSRRATSSRSGGRPDGRRCPAVGAGGRESRRALSLSHVRSAVRRRRLRRGSTPTRTARSQPLLFGEARA